MNNKGMTLVELITTFALTTVIVVLLINVIVVIRNIYSKASIKSELYINQSNLSIALNSKINNDNLDSYVECTDTSFCYIFNFINGESIKLTVSDNQIKFGEVVYKLNEKTKVENPSLSVEYLDLSENSSGNNILVLKIPVICELYPNIDFGINLVYLYNIS